MPVSESDRARWRSAVAGVLAKSSRKDPADLGAEPERLLDSPTYDGFPIRPLYTALDALPEPPLPGQWPYVRGGDALRDVKSGWKVAESFPVRRTGLGGRRQRRGAGRADGGHQCAGAAGGDRRRRRSRARPDARRRLPRAGAGDPRRPGRGADYVAAADARAGTGQRPRRRTAREAVGRPRRRPAHRTADRSRPRRRSTRSLRPRSRRPGTTAGCGPSPSTVPPSTISARARRGNSQGPSPPA